MATETDDPIKAGDSALGLIMSEAVVRSSRDRKYWCGWCYASGAEAEEVEHAETCEAGTRERAWKAAREEIKRLQWLAAELQRVRDRANELEAELDLLKESLGPYAVAEDESANETLGRLIRSFKPRPTIEAQTHPTAHLEDAEGYHAEPD